jgi:hypothetical protein
MWYVLLINGRGKLMVVTITFGIYTSTDHLGCFFGAVAESVPETIEL